MAALLRRGVVLAFLLFVFSFCPFPAMAQIHSDADIQELGNNTEESAPLQENGWFMVLRMLGALAFILALIILTAWLIKRYAPQGQLGTQRSDVIRVVATKMLGGRKSLALVRVRGQTLLLGITPQKITCLTEIQEMDSEWAQTPEGKGKSGFENQLRQSLHAVVDEPEES